MCGRAKSNMISLFVNVWKTTGKTFLYRAFAPPCQSALSTIRPPPYQLRSRTCPKPIRWSTSEPKRFRAIVQALANALIRADNLDNLRATVLAWITPLPDARCISGCAA